MQISICIPTRNRAAFLGRCLDHLLTFSKLDFEVIIGDNASTDDTKATVERYANRFSRFTYHRHEQDIGFARNMDTLLRMACGRYLYILSDDDMVFENALVTMSNILDGNPAVASITGRYQSLEMPEIGKDFAFQDVKGFSIPQGRYADWFAALTKTPFMFDGHPLMRREAFQRHCWYHDRGFALGPLHTQLLAAGDLLFIDQPVFQHCRNASSLSTQMTEPWFHDYCHADIELMCSMAAQPATKETVEAIRRASLRVLYLQSARFARLKDKHALMWHFLRRAKAVGGVDEACLVQCERDFLLRVSVIRLTQIIADLGVRYVTWEDTPVLDEVWKHLTAALPTSISRVSADSLPAKDETLRLLKSFDSALAGGSDVKAVIAFFDVVETCRLTRYPIRIDIASDHFAVHFSSAEGSSLLNSESSGYRILAASWAGTNT
ncbi:MAG: glycosyltransferase family 2 protein [Bryobacteraceae bacterium]|nr:glycosyltransferase family 2 protein [Bryobacteraceae bacterium]